MNMRLDCLRVGSGVRRGHDQSASSLRCHRSTKALSISIWLTVLPTLALAGAVFDGTTGTGMAGVPKSGVFNIEQAEGTPNGQNLFHSFRSFSVNTGESATFKTDSGAITNVIARVTGLGGTLTASQINGLLKLEPAAGAPALYLINPAGVTFGAGAQIDVPGSFHVSTADRLIFSGGAYFSATNIGGSTFSTADPEAFGFLGSNAPVEFRNVQADGIVPNPEFTALSFDVSGGAIQFDNASISIPNAKIRVVSTGEGHLDLPLSSANPTLYSGPIRMDASSIDTSEKVRSADAGTIIMMGGDVILTDSRLESSFYSGPSLPGGRCCSSGNPGSISVHANRNFRLLGGSSLLATSNIPMASRLIGSIRVTATNELVAEPTLGNAGTPTISVLTPSFPARSVEGFSGIDLDGGSVRLVGTLIRSGSGESDSAPIYVHSHSSMDISGGTTLSTQLFHDLYVTFGSAAPITLLNTGTGDITIANSELLSASYGGGGAGGIGVKNTGGSITLLDSRIAATTRIAPGSITLEAARDVSLGSSTLSTDTFGSASAGAIRITGHRISVDESQLSSIAHERVESLSNGPGSAGPIEIRGVDAITLTHGTVVSSSTDSSQGAAGFVTVEAPDIVIDGNSTVSAEASARSSGQTGNVRVSASEGVTVSNGSSLSIRNDATGGDSSAITPTTLSLTAPSILLDGGQITAASTGKVDASNIAVNFGNSLRMRDAAITTTAQDGNGGAIAINGGQTMWMTNSQILTSVLGLAGNGGNINVNAGTLILQTGFIQANTAAANATGGNVTINVNTLIPSASTLFLGGATPIAFQPGMLGLNVIQAAAPDGVAGVIEVTSPQLDLTGSLSNLAAAIVDTSALSRDLCRIGAGSSLTPIGRGGLAPSAIDALRPEAPPRDSQAAIGSPLSESPTDFRPVSQIALGCLRNGEQP